MAGRLYPLPPGEGKVGLFRFIEKWISKNVLKEAVIGKPLIPPCK
jgi:hypothetical protein